MCCKRSLYMRTCCSKMVYSRRSTRRSTVSSMGAMMSVTSLWCCRRSTLRSSCKADCCCVRSFVIAALNSSWAGIAAIPQVSNRILASVTARHSTQSLTNSMYPVRCLCWTSRLEYRPGGPCALRHEFASTRALRMFARHDGQLDQELLQLVQFSTSIRQQAAALRLVVVKGDKSVTWC
jgi:hypothetical protein